MKHNLSIWRRATPFAFFLLLLPGCIFIPRSPTPRFYTLQSIKETRDAVLTDASSLANAVIGIGPVTLPGYFNRPQIVTKNSDNTIEFAQFDRWAEPLDEAMVRIIAQNFSILLPKINIEIFPWNSAIPVRYQVIMEVIGLDCKLDGEAVLLMQWSILDAQAKSMLLTKRSDYRKSLGMPNYSNLVQAISEILESVSREIAGALTELASKSPALSQ